MKMGAFSRAIAVIPIAILLSCLTINGLDIGHANETVFARETGLCSWYGAVGEIPEGWPTASGEGFHRMAMRAAHKTLPFKTRVRVTNLANKQTVDVLINDRGPKPRDRILDLTFGAFGKIAKHDLGIIKCSYDII